ncbi:MAG TPA: tetratricopeptide repeat protein [Burkholderiaceae bacterium]
MQQLLALFQAQRYAEMETLARSMLAAHPQEGMVWKALGVALQIQGKDAWAALTEAARLLPGDAEAATNLGALQSDRGQQAEAIASHQRALALQPHYAQAHNNLGLALSREGRFEEALASLEQALRLMPRFPEALLNLGNVLAGLGRDAEAVECYAQALLVRPHWAIAELRREEALLRLDTEPALHELLKRQPDHLLAQANLALLLQRERRFDEAVACYDRALAQHPGDPLLIGNRGNALRGAGRFEEALAQYRRAIELEPEAPHHHANLGRALKAAGRIEDAQACYRKVIELAPEDFAARSDLLLLRSYFTDQPVLAEARAFGEAARAVARPFNSWPRQGGKALRVGLVSGDLRTHPVGFFSESVLAALAARGVELYVYSSATVNDELSTRIRTHCQAWREIHGVEDEAAAALIHADRLDVLLDLAGHTANNRLPLFAWRPAPVQASWLGWCATTGMAEIDAYIGDRWITPPQAQADFTERLLPLPESFLCFTPPPFEIDTGPLPALAEGRITFGCFNSLPKLNARVIALWSRLLQALPTARLLLKNNALGAARTREDLLARFAAQGIGADRLVLENASPRADYLVSHRRVDLALDPFPYPGGTTSADALWMGVPVLTLPGASALSRQGESLLRNLGLPDWVARDERDYLDRAIAHAGNLPALAALRSSLRERLLASPLCDALRFAAHLEAALRSLSRQPSA